MTPRTLAGVVAVVFTAATRLVLGAPPPGMVLVPDGAYTPLYKLAEVSASVPVPAFFMDRRPVTHGEFLDFVRDNQRWRRSRVAPLFAEKATYLRPWQTDLSLGRVPAGAPVTHVSWFAARAYCRDRGKVLPTTAQWEFAAAAGEHNVDGSKEAGFHQRILDWYAKPATDAPASMEGAFVNAHGLVGMHGLLWEWVEDFNTSAVTGESRGDTGLERKLFCGAGALRAADFKDYAAFMRYAFRSSLEGTYAGKTLGFRCAMPAPADAVGAAQGGSDDNG